MRNDKTPTRPVFVVGAPRSGTTLVGNIIGNHPHIFVPRGESHYFQDIYARRHEIGDLHAEDALNKALGRLLTLYERFNHHRAQQLVARPGFRDDFINKFSKTRRGYGDLLDCFMTLQAEAVGKCRWGDNTPQDILSIVDIVQLFPECRVIVCVRDVRDFLISYKYQWRMSRSENVARVKSLYHPVVSSLLWRANVEQIREVERVIPPAHWTLIRYEDLVQNPESEVRKICSVVDVGFSEEMLLVNSNNSSFEARKPGIFTGSVGRWKQEQSITPEEICIAELITKHQMQKLGYEVSRTSASWGRVAALLCSSPFALINAAYQNRGRINKEKLTELISHLLRKVRPLIQRLPSQYKSGRKISQRVS